MLTQQIINGLALGGVYALTGVAYSMVYGIARIINFAFGGMFMFGAYASAYGLGAELTFFGHAVSGLSLTIVPALCLGMLVAGVLGWVVYVTTYVPVRNARTLAGLITSLGALIFLQSLGSLIFSDRELPYPTDNAFGGPPLNVAGSIMTRPQLIVLITSVALGLLLMATFRYTTFGLKVRACAEDRGAAELQGVNTKRIVAAVFVVGSMLAGVAGALWGALFNILRPDMGFTAGLIGLVAAVVGGIGSIRGALAGGVFLGVVQSLGVAYVPGASAFGIGFVFAALIVTLWARPQGLFVSEGVARGSIERRLRVFTRHPSERDGGRPRLTPAERRVSS